MAVDLAAAGDRPHLAAQFNEAEEEDLDDSRVKDSQFSNDDEEAKSQNEDEQHEQDNEMQFDPVSIPQH